MAPQRCVLRLAWRKVSHSCNPQACQKRVDRQKASPLCKLSSAVLLTQPLYGADAQPTRGRLIRRLILGFAPRFCACFISA
jgi:hypothetical protein